QVGLAFATSIGVWINFALLVWFAHCARLIEIDARLRRSAVKLAAAGLSLALALYRGAHSIPAAWPAPRPPFGRAAAPPLPPPPGPLRGPCRRAGPPRSPRPPQAAPPRRRRRLITPRGAAPAPPARAKCAGALPPATTRSRQRARSARR